MVAAVPVCAAIHHHHPHHRSHQGIEGRVVRSSRPRSAEQLRYHYISGGLFMLMAESTSSGVLLPKFLPFILQRSVEFLYVLRSDRTRVLFPTWWDK